MSFRTTFVLLALFLLVGGYALFSQLTRQPEKTKLPPWVYTMDDDALTAIDVTYQETTMSFRRDDRFQWHFDRPDGEPVNLERWGGIPLLLSGPRSQRVLAQEANDLSPYGLDSPQMVVKLGFGGQPLDILVGDRTPDGKGYYMQVRGYPGVYTVDYTWGDVIQRLVTEPPVALPTTPLPVEG
ncbi:MAG: DUF4340 domain-containing protein [Chloroflexi bacterium]|nr:DUF4340 domain-containing protein [Chloroflexota bacterium]